MTFKIIMRNESSGLCMNGADLFEILPLEVQEIIEGCDSEEVKSCFDNQQLIYLSAGKPVLVTDETVTTEMEEVLGATFSDIGTA